MISVTLKSIAPVMWEKREWERNPDIVVPSIESSLRKWYRWYLASVIGPDPERIESKVNEVFGKTSIKIGSLKVNEYIYMDENEPFLEALHLYGGKLSYMVDLELIMEAENLTEVVKALSVNLSLSGFGYRSERGYGSFRILSYGPEEVSEILEITKKVTFGPSASAWVRYLGELFKELGVRKLEKPELHKVQSLSNCYIISRGGYRDWKKALLDLKERLEDVERDLTYSEVVDKLRSKGINIDVFGDALNDVDYWVLLGAPVLDPYRRRPLIWPEKRETPLFIRAGDGHFVGALFISNDYPERILNHFKKKNLLNCFERIRRSLEGVGFDVEWVGDLI